MSQSTRIAYLLYLAGVEVPCVSVQINGGTSLDSSAVATIPPHPIMSNFGEGDKVQAAIFYLDSWHHRESPTWCLLYEGYVAGIQYSSTPMRKEIAISIRPNMAVLGNLFLEFLSGGDTSSGKSLGKAGKVIPNQITLKGKYPGRLFTVGLDDKTQIRTPYEFFQNIVLATTGKYKDKDLAPDGTKKQISEEIDRIKTVVRLNYETKLASFSSESQKNEYIAAELGKISAKLVSLGISDVPSSISDAQDRLIEESIKSVASTRSLTDRTPVATGFFARYCNLCKLHKQVVASPILEGFVTDFKEGKFKLGSMPTGIFPILRTKNGSNYSKGLAKQTGYKYGDNGSALSLLLNMFTVFDYSLQHVIAPPAYDIDSRGLPSGTFSKTETSAIASYITKPDTNYSMPPACNIILPCLRTTIQYSAQYDSKPTRVYYNKISQLRKLNTEQKLGTGYASLDSQVGFPAAIARHAYDSTDTLKSGMEVLVFPEEYFAGPKTVYKEINPMLAELDRIEKSGRLHDIPGQVKSSDFVDYKSIPANQAAFLRDAFVKSDSKDQKNYEVFLKQAQVDYEDMRSAQSTCTVTMPFNPYIVAGFSAVVIDSDDCNNHIIGTVGSISHSLSQGSASTTVTLTAARSLHGTILQCLLDGGKYHVAPLEPITEIRAVLQNRSAANYYYGNLLYKQSIDSMQPIESDNQPRLISEINKLEQDISATPDTEENSDKLWNLHSKLLDLRLELLTIQRSDTNYSRPDTYRAVGDYMSLLSMRNYYDKSAIRSLYSWSSDLSAPDDKKKLAETITFLETSELIISPEISDLATDYTLAMDYCSRPVCTLDQYIDFYAAHQDLITGNLTGGRGTGCRIGKMSLAETEPYKTANYWKIIRQFVGGPGIEPGAKSTANAYLTTIQSEYYVSAGELDGKIKEAYSNAEQTNNASLTLYYIGEGPNNTASQVAFSVVQGEASFTQLPDLAKDWQSLLLSYSELIKK